MLSGWRLATALKGAQKEPKARRPGCQQVALAPKTEKKYLQQT